MIICRFIRSSPYKVLGIEKTASEDVIKKAYFKLAKLYHPDVRSGSDVLFT